MHSSNPDNLNATNSHFGMKARPTPEMVNSEKKTVKRIGDAKEPVTTLTGKLSGVNKLARPRRLMLLRDLIVGDAVFDFRHELRCDDLHHLEDPRSKLVENVDPRAAANR